MRLFCLCLQLGLLLSATLQHAQQTIFLHASRKVEVIKLGFDYKFMHFFSKNQYVRCDAASNAITTKIYTCAAGQYCRDNTALVPSEAKPCHPISEIILLGLLPNCNAVPTIEVVADPISSPVDVKKFCEKNGLGRFASPNFCNEFIYCYAANNAITGKVYTCPNSGLLELAPNGNMVPVVNGVFSDGTCKITANLQECG